MSLFGCAAIGKYTNNIYIKTHSYVIDEEMSELVEPNSKKHIRDFKVTMLNVYILEVVKGDTTMNQRNPNE